MEIIENVYIHIPFCDSKCPYCDFYSITTQDNSIKNKYVSKLLEEIEQYCDIISPNIRSVYIGGGTPNSLDALSLENLLTGLLNQIHLAEGYEFTVEVNPGSVTEEKLKLFKEFGINRLSVGSQTFLKKELKTLGRTHSPQDIFRTFNTARKLGFNNINLDLIFSIPGQTINSLIYTLNKLAELDPEHISAYMLTYYEGTEFYRRSVKKDLIKIVDDIEVEYYDFVKEFLGSKGFEHYELSNFSKKNKMSNHNLNTWNFGAYIGLGTSAHSFYLDSRWFNDNNVKNYIDLKFNKYPNRSTLSLTDKKNEYIMLGLRKTSGISLENYNNFFGNTIDFDFRKKIGKYLENNYLILDESRLYLNPEKINIYNSIVSDILLD
ncbi:MAG: radical SAM family heme chaperone HemW [Candidatus Delongbacteria bacterium]|nr:radical SAM family heme chaperone HemW [Candidatus Delongbacteria bacterium]